MSNPDLLKLYCWVLGDGPQNVFPVKIASDKYIGTLKEYIKDWKQAMFGHIDANALALYKITVAEAVLGNELEKINLENPENLEKLQPTLKLSGAFSHPPADNHLHVVVIVWSPDGECKCSLCCWY
jgi:Crinkler effector protein N-terminal domain